MDNEKVIECLRDIHKWVRLMRCALKRNDIEAYNEWRTFYQYDAERLQKFARNNS